MKIETDIITSIKECLIRQAIILVFVKTFKTDSFVLINNIYFSSTEAYIHFTWGVFKHSGEAHFHFTWGVLQQSG